MALTGFPAQLQITLGPKFTNGGGHGMSNGVSYVLNETGTSGRYTRTGNDIVDRDNNNIRVAFSTVGNLNRITFSLLLTTASANWNNMMNVDKDMGTTVYHFLALQPTTVTGGGVSYFGTSGMVSSWVSNFVDTIALFRTNNFTVEEYAPTPTLIDKTVYPFE